MRLLSCSVANPTGNYLHRLFISLKVIVTQFLLRESEAFSATV